VSEVRDAFRGNPVVSVQFDQPDRQYRPLQPLGVRYRVELSADERMRAVEHSVLWYTEGKGEEDLGVHFFERITDRGRFRSAVTAGDFATHLPVSPLSYEGVIVKVRWCVRVRVFFDGGRDFVSEHVFEMGHIPPAQMPRERTP
jgi:hypothetical protein